MDSLLEQKLENPKMNLEGKTGSTVCTKVTVINQQMLMFALFPGDIETVDILCCFFNC